MTLPINTIGELTAFMSEYEVKSLTVNLDKDLDKTWEVVCTAVPTRPKPGDPDVLQFIGDAHSLEEAISLVVEKLLAYWKAEIIESVLPPKDI